MAPRRRLNVNEKLLRRFYEPLILLSVFDPTRGARDGDPPTEPDLRDERKLWRDFLDSLALVCDSEKGGDTVTAVAAEQVVGDPLFWLASNSNARLKARDHLLWIFGRLNKLCGARADIQDDVRAEITTRCIQFSAKRVKAYASWLVKSVRKVKQSLAGSRNWEGKRIPCHQHAWVDDLRQIGLLLSRSASSSCARKTLSFFAALPMPLETVKLLLF